MIRSRVLNMELVLRRKRSTGFQGTSTVDGLSIDDEDGVVCDDIVGEHKAESDDEDAKGPDDMDMSYGHADDEASDAATKPLRGTYPDIPSLPCGALPGHLSINDYLGRPHNANNTVRTLGRKPRAL